MEKQKRVIITIDKVKFDNFLMKNNLTKTAFAKKYDMKLSTLFMFLNRQDITSKNDHLKFFFNLGVLRFENIENEELNDLLNFKK